MSEHYKPLLRALTNPAEDTMVCAECQEQLSDYVTAVLNRQQDEPAWQALRRHLTACPYCTAVYSDLLELVGLAEAEQSPPPAYPAPDLGFLRPAAPPPQPWRLTDLGRLIVNFSSQLLATLQLPAQPALAGAGLKSEGGKRLLQPLHLADLGEDLVVTIMVEQMHGQPGQAVVLVEVQIPSRGGWPNLAGSTVSLRQADQLIASRTTNAFGRAAFDGIAVELLDQLVFEIDPVK